MRILITGGGSAIAQAVAEKLKEKGHDFISVDKNMLDITDDSSLFVYLDNSILEGCFDVIINCAGVIFPEKIVDSDGLNWIKQIEVNLIGTYMLSRHGLANGVKTIIHIGSTSGLKGRAEWSAYSASKAGVISLVQSLAAEGVDAYCISPGRTKTEMRKKLFPNEDGGTLLDPSEIANVVIDILDKKYKPGDNIVIQKNEEIKVY